MMAPARLLSAKASIIYRMLGWVLLLSCTSVPPPSKKLSAKAPKRITQPGQRITMRELIGDLSDKNPRPASSSPSFVAGQGTLHLRGLEPFTPAPKVRVADFPTYDPSAQGIQRTTKMSWEDCATALEQIKGRYLPLAGFLTSDKMLLTKTPLEYLLQAEPTWCQKEERRATLMREVEQALESHSGRIGLILPLSGRYGEMSQHIVKGMRILFSELGVDFDRYVLLRDASASHPSMESEIAELILKHNVELIVGGVGPTESENLARWSASLAFPMLLLSANHKLAQLSPTTFVSYPNQKLLAETLAGAAIAKGKRKLAILKPSSGRADQIIEYFRNAVTSEGGEITTEIVYTPGHFESMQKAAKTLFHVDTPERAEELKEAYKKVKEKAEEAGVPFNPRDVLLPPLIDFDALFLPDDFRSVRHFSKLFKYHKVEKLTLIGHHEWRSLGLVDPPDEFLNGSFFADFVGSYAEFPRIVRISRGNSPWFVDPELVTLVDFRVIGYRSAKVIMNLLSMGLKQRRHVAEALSRLELGDKSSVGMGRTFDKNRSARWPTYVFTIEKNELQLLDSARVTR